MVKRLAAMLVLAAAILAAPAGVPARSASTTPVVGDWPFCTSDSQVGCIEYFSLEDASGVMKQYATLADAKYDGISVTARCWVGIIAEGSPCVPTQKTGCGSPEASVTLGISPESLDRNMVPQDGAKFLDRHFVMRVRTGDFDPVFALGGKIDSTRRTKLESGLFVFELSGQIQRSFSVNYNSVPMTPPENYRSRVSEFLKTSKATTTGYSAGASVYPPAFLKSTSLDLNGLCVEMPFVGAFADTNGMGFTTTWVPAKPTDPVASTIKLEVSGPHFLPDSNGADDKIVPARIRFFLPDQFFIDAGYKDPSSFDASRMLITTLDGQKPVPTLTPKTGGVLVDFGITHYSAPDPVVMLYRNGMSASTTTVPAATTTVPLVATTATTATTAPSGPSLVVAKGKSMSSSKLVSTSGLGRPAGSKVVLKVASAGTRYCRVFGTSVKGLAAGTCRVTVTVTPKKGKSKSKTVSLRVT